MIPKTLFKITDILDDNKINPPIDIKAQKHTTLLKDIITQLKVIKQDASFNPKYGLMTIKSLLKNLIGIGSNLASSTLKYQLDVQISKLISKEDAIIFLGNCTNNFQQVFAMELMKLNIPADAFILIISGGFTVNDYHYRSSSLLRGGECDEVNLQKY
jgi:hypothetical protein